MSLKFISRLFYYFGMQDFYIMSKYLFIWQKYYLKMKLERMQLSVAANYYDTRIKRAVFIHLKVRANKTRRIKKMCFALKKDRYTKLTDFLSATSTDITLQESTLKLIFAVHFYRMKILQKYFKILRN